MEERKYTTPQQERDTNFLTKDALLSVIYCEQRQRTTCIRVVGALTFPLIREAHWYSCMIVHKLSTPSPRSAEHLSTFGIQNVDARRDT